ncbi:tetratricopeptide repeat protein [Marispirochaeta sp.]|jgi:tetratricopeptide (TPR) repeat protein|uniref:tetratricopeptide repeat protein n=1 Tax=Marispirochaeta sp. TaxID=2038653 RepID=UPI0029C81436|nr:tetratricopeptide repeat protein [Marispirochaeta sp.]
MDVLVFLIPFTIVVFGAGILLVLSRGDSNREKRQPGRKVRSKDRNQIIKESNRRLAQNPKDADALLALGELYFSEQVFDKSMRTFEVLMDLCATNKQLNEFDITLKYALSALRMKQYEEAYKSLVIARTMNPEGFEVNYNLGYLEYLKKNYEKAVQLLTLARKEKGEHVPTLRYLGHSLFRMNKFNEAVAILRKTIDLEPDDKESLFAIAQCYHELGQNDNAIKIFSHLRADPVLGPSAALFAGTIRMNQHQYDKAMLDFEIGLRHQKIPEKTLLELKYRLASAYIKQQEIGPALRLLEEIHSVQPVYRDVPNLLRKYRELHGNQNLQTYLISGTSDFVTLCRKVVNTFFPKAKVKIVDVSVQKSEYADILAEVSTSKWEDLVLFRFVRTTNTVGELILRDLYSHSKEVKAGRGFCLSAGDFSDGAHQFVEARLIDLIEKEDLMKRLNQVGHSRSVD